MDRDRPQIPPVGRKAKETAAGSETLAEHLHRAAAPRRAGAGWGCVGRELAAPRRRRARSASRNEASSPALVPGARSAKLARVEAALFVAAEPLSSRRLAEIANLQDGAEARTLVQELLTMYEADATPFTVEPIAGGWQLRTRHEFAPWLTKLGTSQSEVRLSQPALETLAVVAYRQPVLRSDVEAIRGVVCGEMLRQLIDRGLVRIVGHHDSLGRPLLYGTTRRFLEVFGLADLSDLPMAEQLRAPASREQPASQGPAAGANTATPAQASAATPDG